MMALKIYLFINKQLVCYIQKKTNTVTMFLVGNPKNY